MNNVLCGGAHRGAESLFKQIQPETVRRYDPHWILTDPKPDRAVQLASMAQNRFPWLQPQPKQLKVQNALAYSRDHDSIVLALDTVADTTETLEARLTSQCGLFQITGCGPGGVAGTRLAIQGTLCPGDHDTAQAALLFLHTLAGMSQAASSRHLTGPDPLTWAVLKQLRQVVSRQTAQHLAEREREPEDLSGGPLSVTFGLTLYPLIPVQGVPQDTNSQRKALALDMAGKVPAKHVVARGLGGGCAIVAVVIPQAQAIHFIKVAQNMTGKRSIDGVTSFVSPRVTQSSSSSKSAAFTD
jgi:hypothetical protein